MTHALFAFLMRCLLHQALGRHRLSSNQPDEGTDAEKSGDLPKVQLIDGEVEAGTQMIGIMVFLKHAFCAKCRAKYRWGAGNLGGGVPEPRRI